MTIKIGNHTFNGLYHSTDSIEDKSGVYTIICKQGDKTYVTDVGESATPKSRLDTHDRKDCWKRKCQGTLTYAVKYTPNLQQEGRKKIEQEIREQFDPPCGKT